MLAQTANTCLHAAVVDDHRLEIDARIELGYFLARLNEQAVAKFPILRNISK